MVRVITGIAAALVLALATAGPARAQQQGAAPSGDAAAEPTVRFATFNARLSRSEPGALREALREGDDAQIRRVAEIIQRVRPDVLLINEFDHDPAAAALFRDAYLGRPQGGDGRGATTPISYPHLFTAPVNAGRPSGADLDGDGTVGGPGDAFGYGEFPGQYGMLVLSRHPIVSGEVRSFRTFLWADMPEARLPVTGNGAPFYGEAARAVLRLSSKAHWDLPVRIGERVVHFLVSHPTPPGFDGPEDRNGRRNADEIRFWADYVDGADYIYDDTGRSGGLPAEAAFVIAGDLNADPFDGDSLPGAARQLLDHPRIIGAASDRELTPWSAGGLAAAAQANGADLAHRGNPAFDTADFSPAGRAGGPGNLRVDYVLPSNAGLAYGGGGVFWPAPGDPLAGLAGRATSDHRLVWVDVVLE